MLSIWVLHRNANTRIAWASNQTQCSLQFVVEDAVHHHGVPTPRHNPYGRYHGLLQGSLLWGTENSKEDSGGHGELKPQHLNI